MKKLREMHILIIGLGQIGGSLGIDLVRKSLVAKVIGYDRRRQVAVTAKRRRIIHEAVLNMDDGLNRADLIILAAPIRQIVALLPKLNEKLRGDKSTAVLDVAGTKTEVLNTAVQGEGIRNFIGGHPIAGTEKSGLAAAQSNLFKNATFVLTPAMRTQQQWLTTIRQLVVGLGARPIVMTATQHDRLIAFTSHLPYVLSLALVHMSSKYKKKDRLFQNFIGGSFRSATRVAASSPNLVLDMLLTNRKYLPNIIDTMISELDSLKTMIREGEELPLRAFIKKVQGRVGEIVKS